MSTPTRRRAGGARGIVDASFSCSDDPLPVACAAGVEPSQWGPRRQVIGGQGVRGELAADVLSARGK